MGTIDPSKDPIILRVEIGHVFDTYGVVELHLSGEVVFVPSAPEFAERLYNIVANMRHSAEQTIEEELCELPFRLNNYTWAGWIDEAGALMLPEGHWRLEELGIAGGWRGRRPPAEEARLSAETVAALDRVWGRIRAEYETRLRRWTST